MAIITQFGTSILSTAGDATPAGASPGTVSIPAIPLDKTVISSADGTQTSTTVYENFSIASLTKNKQTARGFTNSTRYGQIFPRTVYGN